MNQSFIALIASVSMFMLSSNAKAEIESELDLSEGIADSASPYEFCSAFPYSVYCYAQSYYDPYAYGSGYGYYGDYGYGSYGYRDYRRGHYDRRHRHHDVKRNRSHGFRDKNSGWRHGRNR